MKVLVPLALGLTLASPTWAHEGDHPHPHPDYQPPTDAPPAEATEPAPPTEPPPETPSEPEQTGADARRRNSAPATERNRESEMGPRRIPDQDWHQRIDQHREKKGGPEWFEPTHFVFELRFAPYFPQVDEEFGGDGPYSKFFGDKALFYFGLELDWVPFHFPYVGSLGVGFGWGFTSASGNAVVVSTGAPAESETSLDIFPMYAAGVFRIDGPLRKFRIPIVPHIKVGYGFGLWSADGPNGTSSSGGVSGEGTSMGLHLAVGASVALNAFDPSTAVTMREATGIHYAYLYGEWMYANLDGIGSTPQMHVGTSTGVVGIAADF